MKHLFILNPAAGKGKTLKLIPAIEGYFSAFKGEYAIEITEYPGHATEIAARYSAKGEIRIYSVGGDGTLNEVLNGMAGSTAALGVIPAGSGNDFIKSVQHDIDTDDILSRTIEGDARSIDMARVNGKYFVNISSLGFDAQVAHMTLHFKKLPLISGKVAYTMGILTTILQRKSNLLEIKTNDNVIKADALLVAIGNGRYYGGGMMALPKADITDGLLDICLVNNVSMLKILRLFPLYMKGLHEKIKEVSFYKGRKLEIKSAEPIAINMDGEISVVSEAVFEIVPNALSFIFPKK